MLRKPSGVGVMLSLEMSSTPPGTQPLNCEPINMLEMYWHVAGKRGGDTPIPAVFTHCCLLQILIILHIFYCLTQSECMTC